MSRRLVVLLVLAATGLAAPVTSAWAHPAMQAPAKATEAVGVATTDTLPTGEWRAGSSRLLPPWLALICGMVGLVAIGYRPRRALAVAFVLVLAVFAFEHGVHSVHHLDDAAAGATCAVASATAQLAGTPVDTSVLCPIALPLLHSGLSDSSPELATRSCSTHQGRAPPLAA
jgi:hypothetical protein